jgi:hypothetical protein
VVVIACVFKKFMSELPDGRPQASGWNETVSVPRPFDKLRANGIGALLHQEEYYKFNSTPRSKYAG